MSVFFFSRAAMILFYARYDDSDDQKRILDNLLLHHPLTGLSPCAGWFRSGIFFKRWFLTKYGRGARDGGRGLVYHSSKRIVLSFFLFFFFFFFFCHYD